MRPNSNKTVFPVLAYTRIISFWTSSHSQEFSSCFYFRMNRLVSGSRSIMKRNDQTFWICSEGSGAASLCYVKPGKQFFMNEKKL